MINKRGTLDGITVMELGSSFAGPFAARILADLGALVLKVENPAGGDPARGWGSNCLGTSSPAFQTVNHNKRSITADFRNDADIACLKKLIDEKVDVVLQNLRPGFADEMGFGAKETTSRNEKLIYCNIGAFGDYGPYRELPGYDPLMQAFTGIIDVTGDPEGDPARVGVPMIDLGTGMWAVIGILASLQNRSITGKGAIIDSALLETGLAWQSFNFSMLEATGVTPTRSGLRGPIIVPNAAYDTLDGKIIITIGTDSQFVCFCEVIGRPELARNDLFVHNTDRVANESSLKMEIEKVLVARSRDEWGRLFDASFVPNAPVQSLDQAIAHEQVLKSGQLLDVPGETFRQIGLPLRIDGERPLCRRVAPDLGEANSEFGFST